MPENVNNLSTTVTPSFIRVKSQNTESYHTVFPITTTKEVYYRLPNGEDPTASDYIQAMTLEEYLESIHVPAVIHWVPSVEAMTTIIPGSYDSTTVFNGDFVVIGDDITNSATGGIFIVEDNSSLQNITSFIKINDGISILGEPVYKSTYTMTLNDANWILNQQGLYQYTISDQIAIPLDGTCDIEIDFPTLRDIERANDIEIRPITDLNIVSGQDNTFEIILYASYEPTLPIDIKLKIFSQPINNTINL